MYAREKYVYFLYVLRALKPPGWISEWHVGVRVIKSKKLIGFISAVPVGVNIREKYILCLFI